LPALTTAQAAKAAYDPVDDPHIVLLEITEDHVSGALRLARDNTDWTHGGNLYTRSAFEIVLPPAAGEEPEVRIEASNVLRLPGRALLLSRFTLRVRIIVIDTAAPEVALIDTGSLFKVGGWSVDADTVSIQLKAAVSWQEPYPFRRTDRVNFPAAWMTR
jgi:hypothetical protein